MTAPCREWLKINAILLSLSPWSFGGKRLFFSVGFYILSDIHLSYPPLLGINTVFIFFLDELKGYAVSWGVKWRWVWSVTPGPLWCPLQNNVRIASLLSWGSFTPEKFIFHCRFKFVSSQECSSLPFTFLALSIPASTQPHYSEKLLADKLMGGKQTEEMNKTNSPSLCV